MGRILDALRWIESRDREIPVLAQRESARLIGAVAEDVPPEPPGTTRAAMQTAPGVAGDSLRDLRAVESLLVEAEKAATEALDEIAAEPSISAGAFGAECCSLRTLCGEGPELRPARGTDGEKRELPDPLGALAETVLRTMSPGRPACFLFTSPDSDILGAELLAPLAMSLAGRLDSQLLLIDTNLRRPALAARLGVEASRGVTDLLSGSASWHDVVRRTMLPGVDLLPAVPFSTPAGRPPDRLNLEELFAEARQRYQLVLIHASSLKHPEVAPIARHCEGVYLMVRLCETSRSAAAEAVSLLRRARANLFGCVVIQ